MKKFLSLALKILLVIITIAILYTIVLGGVLLLKKVVPKVVANYFELLALPLGYLIFQFIYKKIVDRKTLLSNKSNFILKIMLAGFFVVILNGVIILFLSSFVSYDLIFRTDTRLVKWFFMIAILFEMAFLEEFIFRKLILQITQNYFSSTFFIIFLNALLFCLIHFQSYFDSSFNPFWFLAIFMIGFFFSTYVVAFQDLTFVIVFHSLWNISSTLFYENDSNFNLMVIKDYDLHEAFIGKAVALIVMIFCLVLSSIIYRRKLKALPFIT